MAILFYFVSAMLIGLGTLNENPLTISLSQVFLCLAFLVGHYSKYKLQYINPILVYTFIMGLTSLAHFDAFTTANPFDKEGYFQYAATSQLALGMQIFYWGVAAILLGFSVSNSSSGSSIFSKIYYELPKSFSYRNYTIFIIFLFFASKFIIPRSLGYIVQFIQFLPLISIFFMARKGTYEDRPELLNYCMPIVAVLTIHAILFSYLRQEMIQPVVVYFLGIIIGKSSIRPLFNFKFIPFYIFIGIYAIFFNIFGEIRENSGEGVSRIYLLQEKKHQKDIGKEETRSGYVRLSLINQLSQIGQVVKEDGFYNGSTLSYFIYVFIPRFLWPDKPKIAQGAWFALRIGQARLLDGGFISNSINMTIQGELYLNFGWIGVLIGGFLFGYFFAALWKACLFWQSHNNFLGTMFALFLFLISLTQLGADLQVIVTLIAMYLVFLGVNKGLKQFAF